MPHTNRQPTYSPTRPYSYHPQRPSIVTAPRRRTRNRRPFLMVAILGVILVSCWGIGSRIIHAATQHPPIFSTTLAAQISTVIKQNPEDQISVSLLDTATGTAAHYGTPAAFDAASTAKVITACAYYHLAEQGKVSINAPMGYYNAQFNLQEMINDSDNDAWSLLANVVSIKTLQTYATSIGIHYNTTNNTLSSSDMALLLGKLYAGKLLNSADTAQLLSYMKDTNDEALIPAALPSDITIYHKYGLLDGNLHDASIITKNGHAYSFVIYTKNTDDSDDDSRTTVIHQLTQIVVKQLFNE